MRKEREALLIAALAGLVIVGAAAFVVQPGLGGKTPDTRLQYGDATIQATALAPGKVG
jgi:hypothetical protein